ncbi:MAG: hypothetical protein PHD51_00285 [Patescibacteria group bacterium]|nr:hypothetical protein [Patescibacteria group bacterium]MDD5490693.1 hypothetical protein [Patescibacteria group bacterium]
MNKLFFTVFLFALLVGPALAATPPSLTKETDEPKTPLEIFKENRKLIKISSTKAAKILTEKIPQTINSSRVVWINEKPYYSFDGTQEIEEADGVQIKFKTTYNVSAENGEIAEISKALAFKKGGGERIEPNNDLLLLVGNDFLYIYNVPPELKEKIRAKMMLHYFQPLISFPTINDIRQPYIAKQTIKILVQQKKDCDSLLVTHGRLLAEIAGAEYDLKVIKTRLWSLPSIWDDECLLKTADADGTEALLTELNKKELLEQVKEGFIESKLTVYWDSVRNAFWRFIFRVQNLFRK